MISQVLSVSLQEKAPYVCSDSQKVKKGLWNGLTAKRKCFFSRKAGRNNYVKKENLSHLAYF